ncbi:MAG: histidine--tRNA ligase [Oscillospiraceae bacterium]|nr:histidine--tRNA ligase [Oscillospiraceae bacterium]
MALLTNAPRGTQDILPSDSFKWRYVEATALDIAEKYGFKEIRTPVFEHTELFSRGVGETTDVVQKEMYTFNDKGGRSISLRPEGTAGVCRSVIEHGLLNDALPLKTSYVVSCFRYEKPQKGRFRELHQFGVEAFGASSPSADAEVISLAKSILDTLCNGSIRLEINSIGCPECRKNYQNALKEYFSSHSSELCETCNGRLERNPMRILDCKSPVCKEISKNAPKILDYICADCKEHFDGLKKRLDALGIDYTVNPTIVRGLDYYTRTVFEFISDDLGSQSTVCGGGRYDGLVESLGGPKTPALGFGMGLDRLVMLMQATGCLFPTPEGCDVYIGSSGENAAVEAMRLVTALRDEGFCAECDTVGRSIKAQMKYCDKLGAKYSAIIGDNELESGIVEVKDMRDGSKSQTTLSGFVKFIYNKLISDSFDDISDAFDNMESNFSK